MPQEVSKQEEDSSGQPFSQAKGHSIGELLVRNSLLNGSLLNILLRLAGFAAGILLLWLLDIWTGDADKHFATASDNPLPSLSIILFFIIYLLLMLFRPKIALWSRWRFIYTYLLIILVLTFVAGTFGAILLRLLGYIAVAAVVIQARAVLGKLGLWVIGSILCTAILVQTLLTLNAPQDGVSWSPLQISIWLCGLAFVHTFTGLAAQERMARLRNEDLVKKLTDAQEQLRAYAVNAEELAIARERARLARELHDTLAQGLAAIKMHLETGSTIFTEEPALARQHLEYARSLAGEYLQETRTSLLALRTSPQQEQLITASLDTLIQSWKYRGYDVDLTLPADLNLQHLSPIAVLGLYRVTQEALTNAFMHGRASSAEIEFSLEEENLYLTITDNGQGFAVEAVLSHPEEGHFGLIGMRERMRLLKGHLEVLSAPGAGTQIVAIVPCSSLMQSLATKQ